MIPSQGFNLCSRIEIPQSLPAVKHRAVCLPVVTDLLPSCVHVWRVALDQDSECLSAFVRTLSADEAAKRQRYRFDKDKNGFAIARGALRYLLAAYLGTQAQTISFAYGANGKPDVKNSRNDFPLHFNISYSHDTALMAFVLDADIGIDIEQIRAAPDMERVAGIFFSAEEKVLFEKLSDTEKLSAFYRYWTFKEAYMKARGKGLKLDPKSFTVSIHGDQAGLVSPPACDGNRDGWQFSRLDVGTGYEAVVVNSGNRVASISLRSF